MRLLALLCLSTAGVSILNAGPYVTCANAVTSIKLPNAHLKSAKTIQASAQLPEFCQVEGYVATRGLSGEPDDKVNFEVDLPAVWNGKLYFAGGSGFIGGRSNKRPMAKGYATAYTDTGHDAASAVDATWALNSMTKKVDFFDRGIHVATVAAKAIMQAFYEKRLEKSYFVGCSTGGKQAFIEAQRFPDDFDGIIAGAPAVDYTGLMIEFNWNEKVLLRNQDSYIPASKVPLIAKAVLAHCDAKDGLADGLISEPRKCDFNPDVLRCHAPGDADCLTAAQVDSLKKLYAGPGKNIFPGMPIGHEDSPNYSAYIFGNVLPEMRDNLLTFPGDYVKDTAAAPFEFAFQREFFRYLAFHPSAPDYDWRSFDAAKDMPKLAELAKIHNALDANLTPFAKHGGKLIIYNGWADPVVPPLRIVEYYETVEKATRNTQSFARLFLAPGMNHCGGGPGPNSFDSLGALEQWSERGIAPDQMIASHTEHGVTDRTRPLCPYPQVARYKGSGSVDDAANFDCVIAH